MQNAIDRKAPLASALRWPAWLAAVATNRMVQVDIGEPPLRMELVPKLHSFGSTSIFIKRERYEPELKALAALAHPGMAAIDIGASFGIYSLFLARAVGPTGCVHSLEPGSFSFAQLSRNIALNPQLANIVPHQIAASECEGKLTLVHLHDSPVNFSIGNDGAEGETVRAARVDAIIPPTDREKTGIIKIDVEGFEIPALKSAQGVIEATHPVIMFEVSREALARQEAEPANTYDLLSEFGYAFWRLENDRFEPVSSAIEGNIFAALRKPEPAR